jgi:NADP-dependent aldehyde dehydrogenase
MANSAELAFQALLQSTPEQRANALERLAHRLQNRSTELAALAHRETALPIEPRLVINEIPRTINQLKLAAAAARDRAWALPTIDAANNIRSMLAPMGPLLCFGPNNFPFAFNAVSGGDFASALAVGCPIIAKANPGHWETTYQLAVEAFGAIKDAGLHPATIQLFYHCSVEDGLRFVKHPKISVVSFTGSKFAGLALKKAADEAGKPIYLEMGSVNPVVILPGALTERGESIAKEYVGSCLLGTGQFCTNPGLVFLLDGTESEAFVAAIQTAFHSAPTGPLLSAAGKEHLMRSVAALHQAGAEVLQGGKPAEGSGFHFENTLLRVAAKQFLAHPRELQTEAFGPVALMVVAKDLEELAASLEHVEGSLTGSFYTDSHGNDDGPYRRLEPILRRKVGRLLNDKMPTGVTVSPATHHGGPFPAAWHPGFSAIGFPGSLRRFGVLQCYENVRDDRLPAELRNKNTSPPISRFVQGRWTTEDLD